MIHTLSVARRVLTQLAHDRRLLALSVAAPLAIIYLLKLFLDTMPPGFDVARYAVPVAAFLVHFLAFLLCAIVLVQERTEGTLARMLINGYRRPEILGGYLLGYLGLATLQAVAALIEVLILFKLSYPAETLIALFIVVWLLAIASVMLGIFISTFARNAAQVFPFIPLVILPSVFLSGLLVDVTRLPQLLPLFYANQVIQILIGPNGSLGPGAAMSRYWSLTAWRCSWWRRGPWPRRSNRRPFVPLPPVQGTRSNCHLRCTHVRSCYPGYSTPRQQLIWWERCEPNLKTPKGGATHGKLGGSDCGRAGVR
ncbi:MAG TPA: ABC transporter permease [Chloroflexota bacterium]|nr:ABC transporter permease [Chloroflexota bacterium]